MFFKHSVFLLLKILSTFVKIFMTFILNVIKNISEPNITINKNVLSASLNK